MAGGERVASNMADYFVAKLDYEVDLVSISQLDSQPAYRVNPRVGIASLGINLSGKSLLAKFLAKLKSVFAMRRYLRSHYYDVVLGTGTYPSLLMCFQGRSEAMLVGCEHLSYSACPLLWRIMRRIMYPALDWVVTLTMSDKPNYQRFHKNVRVIPNSRSFFPERPAELENPRILTVGRIDYQKGYDLLLEVAAIVCTARPNWRFRIIGDGPLADEIKRSTEERGLSDAIEFCDVSSEIQKEYLCASLYLMTSRFEGLPMVLLEAQACGLPIVSFDCPTGPSDIVTEGVDGYLIEPFDCDAMAEHVTRLIDDQDRRTRFGRAARTNSDRFAEKQVYAAWQDLFEQRPKISASAVRPIV